MDAKRIESFRRAYLREPTRAERIEHKRQQQPLDVLIEHAEKARRKRGHGLTQEDRDLLVVGARVAAGLR